jgi:hypothetical protein
MSALKCALITCLLWLTASGASPAANPIIVSDVFGHRVAPLGAGKRKATVLIYITNDCPIANACAPEIERIVRKYEPKKVGFCLVYVDSSLTAAAARKHRQDYGYTCPAVLDPDHKLVAAGKAEVTPEAAVFAPDGKLVYHGRIDDRAVAFGQVRSVPTRKDLCETLNAYLQGKSVPNSYVKAVGCNIADLGRK